MREPIVPTWVNVLVCAGLLALTFATTVLGRIDLPPWNLVIALAIAGGKALLIVLWFMHLRFSASVMSLVAAGALLWLGLLLMGTMDDYMTRAWIPVVGW